MTRTSPECLWPDRNLPCIVSTKGQLQGCALYAKWASDKKGEGAEKPEGRITVTLPGGRPGALLGRC